MSLLEIETRRKTPLAFVLPPEVEEPKEKEPKEFADILNLQDREKAIRRLRAGEVVASECLGPFGLMVAVKIDGDLIESERQVDKLGHWKGRDMKDQPAPLFAPASTLDDFIYYEAMTRNGYLTTQQTQESVKHAMIKSGAFFEVALKSPLDKIIPYARIAILNGENLRRPVKTGIVACLDESYPALAKIVEELWAERMIPFITSANLAGRQETLTSAQKVWETFGGEHPDLMILDNPLLKKALKMLEEGHLPLKKALNTPESEPSPYILESSYTLGYSTTGWRPGEENKVEFGRQGNVGPRWVVKLLNQNLDGKALTMGPVRKILVKNPFFDLEMATGGGGGKKLFAIGPHIYEILRPVLNGN